MGTQEWVSIAGTGVQALSVLGTAIYASWGLNSWRKQLVGKRRYEVAEESLIKFSEMYNALKHIRNPFQRSNEAKGSEATIDRIREYEALFDSLRATQIRCRIHIGQKAAAAFDEIYETIRKVTNAAQMLRENRTQPLQDQKLRKELEAIIWNCAEGPDEIESALILAQKNLEKACTRFIS